MLEDEKIKASTIAKTFSSPVTKPPSHFTVVRVSSSQELKNAIDAAHKRGGQTAIYLANGEYQMDKTIRITVPDIMLLSQSHNPYETTIRGAGMKRTSKVQNILEVRSHGFVLDGIRLTDAPNHLIQIAAENNASRPIIRNCILQDSYEQLLKVSYDQFKRAKNISYDGVVEQRIFQYTKGRAPYYYTGGIDALGAKNWRVENNIFKDIASPAKRIAQHAVHFWVNSSGNVVRNNIFIDNDRAIGFGMKQKRREGKTLDYSSKGGEISGNIIYHADNDDPFADTGIVLEASPNTLITENYILMQHSYPRAIEYRFEETTNVLITHNHTNKMIRARDGGSAFLKGNRQNMDELDFFAVLEQALKQQNITHLAMPISSVQLDD
jgi:hypothetical protein